MAIAQIHCIQIGFQLALLTEDSSLMDLFNMAFKSAKGSVLHNDE
jgi:hypothetical protein